MRTIYRDAERYETYWRTIEGVYFAGDSAYRDADGYFWIQGRVDDVIKKAGHRLGSSEIESALVSHPAVAEAAVIGKPDDVKGESIKAFVILKTGHEALGRPEDRNSSTTCARRSARSRSRTNWTSCRACRRPAVARSCAATSRRRNSASPPVIFRHWRSSGFGVQGSRFGE